MFIFCDNNNLIRLRNNTTPTIDREENEKGIDLKVGDFILIGRLPRRRQPDGSKAVDDTETLQIDIMTLHSASRIDKLYKEVERIIENNYLKPHADYSRLEIVRTIDNSDALREQWQYIIDAELTQDFRELP